MKASQFADAQKAFILKQGDEGVSVAEICRKAGDLFQLDEEMMLLLQLD
jgi:putative transposase